MFLSNLRAGYNLATVTANIYTVRWWGISGWWFYPNPNPNPNRNFSPNPNSIQCHTTTTILLSFV